MFIDDQHEQHPTPLNLQAIADTSPYSYTVGAQICILDGHSANLNA